jgi:hypothetical protein
MASSTVSQLPVSIPVATSFSPGKASFEAMVARTKPTRRKGSNQSSADCHLRQIPHKPREHPGHQQVGDADNEERHGARLALALGLAHGGERRVAESGVSALADEKARNGGDNDSEIIDRNGSHLLPPIL